MNLRVTWREFHNQIRRAREAEARYPRLKVLEATVGLFAYDDHGVEIRTYPVICPKCGLCHPTHTAAVRQGVIDGIPCADVGWRCLACGYLFGFEIFGDGSASAEKTAPCMV